jgi:hypothetical protein
MAIERTYAAIGAVALTAPGTTDGVLTLASTSGIKVGMRALLTGPFLPNVSIQIKRVDSSTILEVGSPGTGISNRIDVSAYGSGSVITFPEQNRPTIPLSEISRAVYEEEPTVAIRAILVDEYGNPYSASGGGMAFSVTVKDGTTNQLLKVNPDGSLNVVVEPFGAATNVVSTYAEALAVVSGVTTTVASYTVPVGKTAALQRVEVNGENIADYKVLVNSIVVDRKRTYFGGGLNENFDFEGYQAEGIPLVAGNIVQVTVLHTRPTTGDFGARIQTLVIG